MSDSRTNQLQAHVANGTLTQEDADILAHIPRAQRLGRELKEWYEDTAERDAFTNSFPLLKFFGSSDDSDLGFIESAKLPSGRFDIMGEKQDLLFDGTRSASASAKAPSAEEVENVNEQVREFALRYFMRVTAPRAAVAEPVKSHPAPFLGWMDIAPRMSDEREDIGFFQLYAQHAGSNKLEVFGKADQPAVVDMRELGKTYDWVLVKARLFDFQLLFDVLPPFMGFRFPFALLDHQEFLYGLLTPAFVCDEKNPRPGVVGEYGMGFALVAPPPGQSPMTVGPEVFNMGMNYFRFIVHETGVVRTTVTFCCNQLAGICPLPVSPVNWGLLAFDLMTAGYASSLLRPLTEEANRLPMAQARFDPVLESVKTANRVTGGALGRDYGISTQNIFKWILRKHGTVFNHQMAESARVWRCFPDWLAAASLPESVRRGRKASGL